MKRYAPLFCLAALPLLGCGSVSNNGSDAGIVPGAVEFAIPFLPAAGETMQIGLKNLSSQAATVTATEFAPAGGAGTAFNFPGNPPNTIPAFGEVRVNVIAPAPDGWIHLALPTGLVVPSFFTQGSGPRGEIGPGLLFTTDRASLPITPETTAIQVINSATPANLTATFYDTAGNVTLQNAAVPFGANESMILQPLTPGVAGSLQVSVDMPDGIKRFTMSTREVPAAQASLTFDYDMYLPKQVADQPNETEVALDFGLTSANDYRDFVFVMTNTNDTNTEAVTFESIYTDTGSPILTSPETVTLLPHATRIFATTYINTIGLQAGENHPFFLNDGQPSEVALFGDVFQSMSLEHLRFSIHRGHGVAMTARNFDPAFEAARDTVPAIDQTHDALVTSIDQETITTGAEHNYISLMNRNTSNITVNVQVYTPGGQQYILPALTVMPQSRLDWSPDGLVLKNLLGIREDQNDPLSQPVPFYSFRFTSSSTFGINSRLEVTDAQGVLILLSSHVIEPLDD